MSKRAARGNQRWRKAVYLASAVIVVIGLGSFLRNVRIRVTSEQQIPLAPLAVSPDLTRSDTLPATPGALRGYDVVLVTLDTTRPDRLGCYGNAQSATGNLDRLARDGVIFSAAVATSPMTLPAHASILTGLYPQHHGARANSRYRLDDERRTLAEILAESGYATGAFVSSFVLERRFGLAQGFGVFDDRVGSSPGMLGYAERRADQTTDQAIGWLRSRGSQPYFLWVHYYDPHAPNYPPAPYNQMGLPYPYDGEIALVDHELGRLLAAVESTGRKTLVVAVADHGEALGEHGELSHGHLVQEATIEIPLILQATGGLGRGVHVDTRVSQVDLMPTILSLLGIEGPRELDGVSLLQAPDGDRALLAEAVDAEFGWARLVAVYQGSLKYVDGPSPELYDLARDPLEHNNVVANREADASAMRQELREREGPAAGRLGASNVELGANEIARLEAIGYITGGGVEATGGSRGPDPKVMLPVFIEMQRLVAQYEIDPTLPVTKRILLRLQGRTPIDSRAELIQRLEALASNHPDFAPIYQKLAIYYGEEHKPAEAADAMQRFDAAMRRD
jgi:arylsulfatase A-like enzyme